VNPVKNLNFKIIWRYLFSNFTGTLVDTFFLWLFSRYVFDSYTGKYIIAPSLSFEIAMLKNFFNSYFWIWGDRVEKSVGDFFSRLLFYNLNAVFIFFIKIGLIQLIAFISGYDVIICNLIALVFTGVINLILQDKLIFKTARFPN